MSPAPYQLLDCWRFVDGGSLTVDRSLQDVTQEGLPQEEELPGDEVQRIIRVVEDQGRAPEHQARSTADSTLPPSEDVEMESEEASTARPSEAPSRRVSFLEPQEETHPMEAIQEEQDEPIETPIPAEHRADSIPRSSASDQPEAPPDAPEATPPLAVRVDEAPHGAMSFGPLRTRRTNWETVQKHHQFAPTREQPLGKQCQEPSHRCHRLQETQHSSR